MRVTMKPAFVECSSTISIDGKRPPGNFGHHEFDEPAKEKVIGMPRSSSASG
jgi:hypothetical protein